MEPTPRKSYAESCAVLLERGFFWDQIVPAMPARRPRYDDDDLGVSFFRTYWSGDFSNMTLSRTYFGRSEITAANFKNTDLSESTLCWNDFTSVDFTDANLARSDLRAAIFNGVNFTRCNLQQSDLRRSTFEDCDFTDADMRGVLLTTEEGSLLELSEKQIAGIDWQDDEGEEPGGG